MVKATNSDGVWQDEPIAIRIIIKAPFWKTLAFKIIFALVLTILILYTINSQVRKIRKKQEVERRIFEFEKNVFELEQKVLHLQMNPHFLFNSLNSIQSFIMKNDTDNAVNFMSKFSNLMRLILSTSKSSYIVLQDEIKLLRYYLDIESLRFDNKFEYEITVDSEIDEDFISIPSHMIQPLAENSIKHGLIHKEGKGKIDIRFSQKENHIQVIVEDNGVGRERAEEIIIRKKLQKSAQGILITKERLQVFNRQQKTNLFEILIVDLYNNNGQPDGTKVILNIPFIEI